MTAKRFENRLNKDNIKFNTLNPVWDNEKETGLNVFEMIDLMNELHEENEQLKQRINSRLHYYRELYNHFDKNDGFSYDIVERVVEDLEDILR